MNDWVYECKLRIIQLIQPIKMTNNLSNLLLVHTV